MTSSCSTGRITTISPRYLTPLIRRNSTPPLGRLRSDLGFHLPPRGEDHLLPPPLQQSLPLGFVLTPSLSLLLLLRSTLRACRLSTFLGFAPSVLGELGLQVVPRDEIGREGPRGCGRAGVCRGGGRDGEGWLEGLRRL